MFSIIKNAFSKKKKHNNSFQMEDINQPPPIQKSKTSDFQIIDEQTMSQIEQQYNENQQIKQEDEQQKEDIYMEYVVQEDDSLFGIALKFSVNEATIMSINSLSSDLIFKGQILKVPQTNQPRFSVIRLPDKKNDQDNIWNQDQFSQKFEVIYCHSTQHTEGQLTLTSDIVLFDAHVIQQQQQQQQQKHIRHNACISMRDINEAVYQILTNKNGQKDYIVQIFLSGIGKPNFEKKYHKQLKKLKLEKRSIATVFFRHAERNQEGKLYTEETKKENCIFMARFISEACSDYLDQPQLTRLPYLDIIEDKQKKSDIKLEEIQDIIGERMGKIWASLEYVPQLKEQSLCFTNSSFKQVIESVPPVYRLADWVKYYTIDMDGSSFHNMLLEVKFISPLILIIKDTDMKVFGAYISSELHLKSNGFQGSGETFLFEIQNNETKSYFWTEKNKDFLFCDDTGLGIGCGDKFGLFVDSSFAFGYCNACETFDNVRFSNEEKFRIKHLEVWAISQR